MSATEQIKKLAKGENLHAINDKARDYYNKHKQDNPSLTFPQAVSITCGEDRKEKATPKSVKAKSVKSVKNDGPTKSIKKSTRITKTTKSADLSAPKSVRKSVKSVKTETPTIEPSVETE